MIERRALQLSDKKTTGDCIVYLMSRDHRVRDNHALLLAQQSALEAGLPLVVVFHLRESLGVRAREHYQFMLTGLRYIEQDLQKLNIQFTLLVGNSDTEPLSTLTTLRPAVVYFDFSPLKGARSIQKLLAAELPCRSYVVDTHNIIPLWIASPQREFAAHTMRTKVHKQLSKWLEAPQNLVPHPHKPKLTINNDWDTALRLIDQVPSNGSELTYLSGEKAAHDLLDLFISQKLETYALDRNNPLTHGVSGLSPYLHFGQMSSLRVALKIIDSVPDTPLLLQEARLAQSGDTPSKSDGMNSLLEEMIVRKELADNYCFYTEDYTSLAGAWDWAKDTLSLHADDPRDFVYTLEEFEQAKTHDSAWNAAQNEMRHTGKMHGYMRMYWAKKILEWSPSADEAIKIAVYLNDHYSIDGGDPKGYTGIMWSIAGVHDRPWFDRPIFGKIRYMNEGGLQRRFNVADYTKLWI